MSCWVKEAGIGMGSAEEMQLGWSETLAEAEAGVLKMRVGVG
jgi:hypothetical protein